LEKMSFITKMFGEATSTFAENTKLFRGMLDEIDASSTVTRNIDETATNAKATELSKQHLERFGEARIDQTGLDSIKAQLKGNYDGNPFEGATNASSYQGNILTQAFNISKEGSSFSGIAMGAGVGMLGAAAVGGDAKEGAVFGALAGGSIQMLGRQLAGSIGDLESNFMNSLLKNKIKPTAEIAPKQFDTSVKWTGVVKNADGDDVATPTFNDLIRGGFGDTQMNRLVGLSDDATEAGRITPKQLAVHNNGDTGIDDHLIRVGDEHWDNVAEQAFFNHHAMSDAVPARTAQENIARMSRKEQLNSVKSMTSEEIKKSGFGAQYKQDVLSGKKDLNIGQLTRVSGLAGSALSGMAFSSSRRDHRRGFNKKRGNRV
jgi:hypothetical protein